MLNVSRILIRRFAGRPQTFDLLIGYSATLMAKPPLPPEWLDIYEKTLVGAGNNEPILECWRREYGKIIREITEQKSWVLQKRMLLWHIVKEVGWVALFNTVKPEHPVGCWKGFVEEVDMFKDYDERYQYPILQQRYMLALPSYALLLTLGSAAFGFTQKTSRGIDLFLKNRKDYVFTMVTLGNYYMEWCVGHDEQAELHKRKFRSFDGLVEEIKEISQNLANSLIGESFDPAEAHRKIAVLNRKRNEALQSLGISPINEPKSFQRAGRQTVG